MDASTKKPRDAVASKEHMPLDGSWVAELEDAKAELDEVVSSAQAEVDQATSRRRGDALKAYLRLCRAYSKLRQWKELQEASTKGLEVCASYAADRNSTGATRIKEWNVRFTTYSAQAGRELSVPWTALEVVYESLFRDVLKGRVHPDSVRRGSELFPNTSLLQDAARKGDMRLLETLVALGAAIDYPLMKGYEDCKPNSSHLLRATALVVACANAAIFIQDYPTSIVARAAAPQHMVAQIREETKASMECAMQLVRLGADPTRKFHLSDLLVPDDTNLNIYRSAAIDGKSALELAQLAKCTELVDLMEEHLRCSPEERAQIVHCRCGSRLPWKACHSTGVGQPPHYVVDGESGRVMYRVSPLAKCPCTLTAMKHYGCCWKDTARPVYLNDATGSRSWNRNAAVNRLLQCHGVQVSHRVQEQLLGDQNEFYANGPEMMKEVVTLLKSDPGFLQRTSTTPKSRMATWDQAVYAGCVERLLLDRDLGFFWTDVNWHIDKSELLARTEAWNKALNAYCDDAGLVGDERDRVVAKHRANPCGPCGRIGCDAFEKEVREFQRCSRCKRIAYCGRACQKLDWAEHRKVCNAP